MPLAIGIVGLPNVGKSTLFKALTNKQVEASNYAFCTIDPNIGVVEVPDERLGKLAEISVSEKIIPTTIEFVDIAGLVRGAHQGEGLGNQFLANIRECDALCEVLREFKDNNVSHVGGKIDAAEDRETVNLELIFADLSTIEKRLDRVTKEARAGAKEMIKFRDLLNKIKDGLSQGQAVRDLELTVAEKNEIKSLNLLTIKPIIYILNVNESSEVERSSGLVEGDGKILKIDAKLEAEIASLPPKEQAEFLKELGLSQSGLDRLIKISYDLLNLITFFTTGPKETRAWTVERGTKAPQAAGKIHTDFQEGFIRVEVINWQVLGEAGSEARAKEKGLVRTEGKDYVIQDGDSCYFLFN